MVISIIALLIAILLPALASARDAAKRVACMSNLRQWGQANTAYAVDNRYEILESARPAASRPYPSHVFRSRLAGDRAGEFNLDAMRPYIPGGAESGSVEISLMYTCPNVVDTTTAGVQAGAFFQSHYAYFGRSDRWDASVTDHPEMLTRDELISDRILMADAIYRWGGGEWRVNHPAHQLIFAPPARIEGINRLYGDGRVEWIGADAFDASSMEVGDTSQETVRGGGADKTFF